MCKTASLHIAGGGCKLRRICWEGAVGYGSGDHRGPQEFGDFKELNFSSKKVSIFLTCFLLAIFVSASFFISRSCLSYFLDRHDDDPRKAMVKSLMLSSSSSVRFFQPSNPWWLMLGGFYPFFHVGKTIMNHPPNYHFYRWYGYP